MSYDNTAFGYRPGSGARYVRDKLYPSEIAQQRPALATRIHCHDHYEDSDPALTIRGDHEPGGQRPHDRFNEQLRGGHRLVVDGDSE
jgi:hypothetical protein